MSEHRCLWPTGQNTGTARFEPSDVSVSFLDIVCNHATLAVSKSNGDGSGEMFGPYQVYERIGVGGMASVHRAVKRGIEDFERTVALKRLLSHLAEDESFVKSFVREARLASKLQHTNIIQLYDLGRVGRVYYIAMEYVRGRDLRKVLKQTAYATGPMPVPMMLSLTQQLCDALDYAHTLQDDDGEPLGIVHRDISPSNLLVAADGHLKVIDFGIAKATAASLRTSSGRVKGKFAYMAPEAIKGRPLDHRSDIFSAGIVAYEMLTARPLFASKNEYDTLQKIAHEKVPPPSHLNPDSPPELDEIVLTALAKSPEERWQTAAAMHRALGHVAKKHSLGATRREIAEWVKWAFEQPLQRKRVKHKGLRQRLKERFRTDDDVTNKKKKKNKPALRSGTGPVDVGATEKAKIEIVWGSNAGQVERPGPADSPALSRRWRLGPGASHAACHSGGSGPVRRVSQSRRRSSSERRRRSRVVRCSAAIGPAAVGVTSRQPAKTQFSGLGRRDATDSGRRPGHVELQGDHARYGAAARVAEAALRAKRRPAQAVARRSALASACTAVRPGRDDAQDRRGRHDRGRRRHQGDSAPQPTGEPPGADYRSRDRRGDRAGRIAAESSAARSPLPATSARLA